MRAPCAGMCGWGCMCGCVSLLLSLFLSVAVSRSRFLARVKERGGDARACVRACVCGCHPGVELGANLKSISHRCHLFEVAFVWELTKETFHLPLGCLQGCACAFARTAQCSSKETGPAEMCPVQEAAGETEILVEQQPPQRVLVCDHAGLVINTFSLTCGMSVGT